MAGASKLGLNKSIQKPSSKPTNRRFSLDEVVNYLKSDSFLYSHMISSSSTAYSVDSLPPSTQDKYAIGSEKMMKASEELKEYLKSDSYLYAPLVKPNTQPPSSPPKDTGAQQVKLKKVSRSISYTTIATAVVPQKGRQGPRGRTKI